MKRFLRIIFILIFAGAAVFVFTHPVKTETNILRAVFSDNSADETVVKLSGRYSSRINVLVEAESSENASRTALEFLNSVDKDTFYIEDFNAGKILETYKLYYKSLLSQHTALLLENRKYNEVIAESFVRLYDPFGFMLMPLNQDPFMLFTDYVKSFGEGEPDSVIYNDKYYKILSLEVKMIQHFHLNF